MARWELMTLWNNIFFTPKNFPDRPLSIPQESLYSTDSALIAPACNPFRVAQPYLHLSNFFEHPLNNESLKIDNTFASQNHSYIVHLFLTIYSAAFISTKQYQHHANRSFQSLSYAQVTSSAKVYDNNSETENVTDQSNELQFLFDLFKEIEDIIEPYRANISELSDLEYLKKDLHGYKAACFPYANFQLSLKTMQHSSTELQSAVAILKQVFISNLFSKFRPWKLFMIEKFFWVP